MMASLLHKKEIKYMLSILDTQLELPQVSGRVSTTQKSFWVYLNMTALAMGNF